jgi:hypothetical protein
MLSKVSEEHEFDPTFGVNQNADVDEKNPA